MYGTRDAAKNSADTVSKRMTSIGFLRGVGHPAVYYHPKRGIYTVVHGDDFTSSEKKKISSGSKKD